MPSPHLKDLKLQTFFLSFKAAYSDKIAVQKPGVLIYQRLILKKLSSFIIPKNSRVKYCQAKTIKALLNNKKQ